MDVVVGVADRDLAADLARLQLTTALAGYGHIFPKEAPPPTHEDLLALWQRWLGPDRDPGSQVFVAHEASELAGVVLAGPDPDEADLGHVSRLYVTPPRWGCGIGRQLYDAAVGHLHAAGFTTATLWVLERNERARAWYERLGWRATDERKAVYAPAGIDDVRYRLDL